MLSIEERNEKSIHVLKTYPGNGTYHKQLSLYNVPNPGGVHIFMRFSQSMSSFGTSICA